MKRFESEKLNYILDYEVQHGNEVARVDEEMWELCKLVIVMKYPLKYIDELLSKKQQLDVSIQYSECRDTHYEIQEIFSCDSTKESLAAPLKGYVDYPIFIPPPRNL